MAFGVAVKAMDLRFVQIPILCGHYRGDPIAGAEGEWLGFETLTHVPIDRALIDTALLDADERAWLDTYHAGIVTRIAPQLDGAARAWLDDACAPLAP